MNSYTSKDIIQGKNIVVVGAGISGIGAARLGAQKGAYVRVLEKDREAVDADKAKLLEDKKIDISFGEHAYKQFADAHMIVLSPGIPLGQIKGFVPEDVQVYSELEFAYWFVQAPVVGVTGTNGKTTTVRLLEHVFRHAGYNVFLGGNIGVPLSEYVLSGQEADILVLEVSSFQLELVRGFRPHVGVLLNISPNHLDFHTDMQQYFRSKMRLFENQKCEDLAIFPEQMAETLQEGNWTRAEKKFFSAGKNWDCPALIGEHNQANIQAAALVCARWGIRELEVEYALQDFQSYPHRLQQVCEKNGVLFIDDSKATTLEALKAALKSLHRPVLLLAGGVFKGGDPESLREVIKKKVRTIALFGESRDIFQEAWKNCAQIFWKETLQEAVEELNRLATPGDVVLLSPGTSSFDLFNSYKERGRAFQEAVSKLHEHSSF